MDGVLQWFKTLINGFAQASSWLTAQSILIGDVRYSPLMFLTFGGLSAFLVVAIAKWLIS